MHSYLPQSHCSHTSTRWRAESLVGSSMKEPIGRVVLKALRALYHCNIAKFPDCFERPPQSFGLYTTTSKCTTSSSNDHSVGFGQILLCGCSNSKNVAQSAFQIVVPCSHPC